MFGDDDGIYVSRFENGKYSRPKKFDTGYDGMPPDGYPFIAPDESYMLFMSWRPGGRGMWDLYITFQREDGIWTSPKNMGPKINSDASESFPSVSPDGKYLFFNSNRPSQVRDNVPGHFYGNIYWVNANVIEELKPENLR
jgi:Tol biopolymer transport system component